MGILEIIGRALLFIVVIPIFAILCAVWTFIIMSSSVLLAPGVCIITFFFKDPYEAFGWFHKKALWLAAKPFKWLQKLIKV